MRAKSIYYEELHSGINYNNRRIGVTVELEPGESGKEALAKAKEFVWKAFLMPTIIETQESNGQADIFDDADDLPF